jgi:aromatic-L-amino-acid decarboxylase
MNDTTALSLGEERIPALELAFGILRESWEGFDSARPGQPPPSEQTLALLAEPLPAEGIGALAALREAETLLDESLAQSRPRFFGYVGSSGLEVGVLAESLSAAHDVNLASVAAAATMVEQQTIGWVGEFVGFGRTGGVVTSGGMVSNLTALTAARERALPGSRRAGLDGRGTLYVSAEAHSSIDRSAEILGVGSESVRAIPIDADRRMDVDILAERIAEDRTAGRVPVAVVGTAGTTLTGAVDRLADIAAVCREYGVWFHVDGAYGLPAAATPSAGKLFDGIELADSATIDAHKWMFVPKACGILLVRDGDALRQAFSHDTSYMVDVDENPVERTLEYSRPFRALKLWTALRAHGAEAFRDALEHNLRLARLLADQVRAQPDLELVVEPQLSTVPFRRIPASGSVDEHNSAIVRRMQEEGDAYVTSAVVDGKTVLRPCITNFRTSEDDVKALIGIVQRTGSLIDAGMER